MGADLYIVEISLPIQEWYEPLFDKAVRQRNLWPKGSEREQKAHKDVVRYYNLMHAAGYFSDPYDASSLLKHLGLSWWSDVLPLCDQDRRLEDESLRKFRAMVGRNPVQYPTEEEFKKELVALEDGRKSLDAWCRYFAAKHMTLMLFLDQALLLDAAVHCSFGIPDGR